MPEYRYAIVGCGMISEFHAAAIGDIDNAKIVAVADVVEEAAKKRGEELNADWYTDFGEMVRRDDIDIVTICTPSGAHMDPSVAAVEAGKHVIVEKPLEITLNKCDAMIEAAEKAGVKLATIFPSRVSPVNELMKKTIESGRLGRITIGDLYHKWWRSQEYYDSGGWRGTWELDGGGALMNQAVHGVDLLQWLMGPVKSIQAFMDTLSHKRIEVEDTSVAILRYENGAMGVIEATTSVYPGMQRRIDIHGDKGSIVVEQDALLTYEFEDEQPDDDKVREQFSPGDEQLAAVSDPRNISYAGHTKQLLDLQEAIEQDRRPVIDGHEGRKAVEIILAIYKSGQEGTGVDLPLDAGYRPKA